jgi:hypothetical protein
MQSGGGGAAPKESVAVIKTSGGTPVGAIFVCRDFSAVQTASVLSSATLVYCDSKSGRELLHRHTR